jgi:hypothetical protein
MRFSNYDVVVNSLNPNYTKVIKSYTGTLSKFDNFIWSYNEVVADVLDTNFVIIYGKTAKFNDYYSHTTSKHTNMIINYCIDNNINYVIYAPHSSKYQKKIDFKYISITYLEPQECPITLQQYTNGCKTICGHEFSTNALTKWLEKNYNCPMCRQSLI